MIFCCDYSFPFEKVQEKQFQFPPSSCLECNACFLEGGLFKCDVRVLDEDWCIMVMRKCPLGKWGR
jgi:hypothetical protein